MGVQQPAGPKPVAQAAFQLRIADAVDCNVSDNAHHDGVHAAVYTDNALPAVGIPLAD